MRHDTRNRPCPPDPDALRLWLASGTILHLWAKKAAALEAEFRVALEKWKEETCITGGRQLNPEEQREMELHYSDWRNRFG